VAWSYAAMAPEISRTIDAVWRMEAARVIAALARMVRDVGFAEEMAQEALVAALAQWPKDGVPDNPGAWLTGWASAAQSMSSVATATLRKSGIC
jgi:predicted RNA polymerase sigma factor